MRDPNLFDGLANFIEKDLSFEERENLFNKTIPNIVKQAKALKGNKPPQGLHFSLPQEGWSSYLFNYTSIIPIIILKINYDNISFFFFTGDTIEYSYAFVASLIANAFFSTYPKRTPKTHPTLKDFNFTNFFKYLHL